MLVCSFGEKVMPSRKRQNGQEDTKFGGTFFCTPLYNELTTLMKTIWFPIALSACLYTAGWAQQKLAFSSYQKISDHFVKAQTQLMPNSNYKFQFDQEFTSILLRIPPKASLLGSYVLVGKDTLRFKKDGLPRTPMQGSQLIVFKSPVSQFQFHSGDIQGGVEFHLYNSQPNVVKVIAMEDPSKEAYESSLTASLAALDRSESLHRNSAVARHPDQYFKKKKRLL